MTLYALIGEDEHGTGKVGIKQGLCPAGYIPLVVMSYDLPKLYKLQDQMEAQAKQYGKKIYLCKFELKEIVSATTEGAEPKEPLK